MASPCSSLSRVSVTSAKLRGFLESLPANIISSIFEPLRDLADCSPSTQRIASVMLLFPLPFGPTTAVTPRTKSTPTRSAKDLNPITSNRFKYILVPPQAGHVTGRFLPLILLIPFGLHAALLLFWI